MYNDSEEEQLGRLDLDTAESLAAMWSPIPSTSKDVQEVLFSTLHSSIFLACYLIFFIIKIFYVHLGKSVSPTTDDIDPADVDSPNGSDSLLTIGGSSVLEHQREELNPLDMCSGKRKDRDSQNSSTGMENSAEDTDDSSGEPSSKSRKVMLHSKRKC